MAKKIVGFLFFVISVMASAQSFEDSRSFREDLKFKISENHIKIINKVLKTQSKFQFSDADFAFQDGSFVVLRMRLVCNKKSTTFHSAIDKSVTRNCSIQPIPYMKTENSTIRIPGIPVAITMDPLMRMHSVQQEPLLSSQAVLQLQSSCFLKDSYHNAYAFLSMDQNAQKKHKILSPQFIQSLKDCALSTFSNAKKIKMKYQEFHLEEKQDAQSFVIFDNTEPMFQYSYSAEETLSKFNEYLNLAENYFYSRSTVFKSKNLDIKTGQEKIENLIYSKVLQDIAFELSCDTENIVDSRARCEFKSKGSLGFKTYSTQHATVDSSNDSKRTPSLLAEEGSTLLQVRCFLQNPIHSSELIHLSLMQDSLVHKNALLAELRTCARVLFSSIQALELKEL